MYDNCVSVHTKSGKYMCRMRRGISCSVVPSLVNNSQQQVCDTEEFDTWRFLLLQIYDMMHECGF